MSPLLCPSLAKSCVRCLALIAIAINTVCHANNCPFVCSMRNGCKEQIRASVTICSQSYKQKLLIRMETECTFMAVPDETALRSANVGDTIEIIALSIDDIPDSDSDDSICSNGNPGPQTRSDERKQASGTNIRQLGYVGDLDLTQQQPLQAYRDDASFYTMFHVYESMVRRWKYIAGRSAKSSTEIIGASFEKRDIYAIRIGTTDENNPKRVIINALLHAREWGSTMVATYIADSLVDAIESRPAMYGESIVHGTGEKLMEEVADLLKTIEVLVVPLSNPDGYIYTTDSRFHRKNMRHNPASSCTGVDLNRNWGVDYAGLSSTSRSKCADVYIGPSVLSEPETVALRNLFAKTAGVAAHIDYHSYGGMILGPWSYTRTETPPNATEWTSFASAMNAGMADVRGSTYRSGLGVDGVLPYSASGVMADWVYDQRIQSATIEVAPKLSPGQSLGLSGFVLDTKELPGVCADNFGAFVGLLRWVKENSTQIGEFERYYAPCTEQ
eukprot:Plantae.Rhodophyta-Palmaria_palmata.ctg9927.p1 GENE.Plantae.Rhodophyta-Palmaria_palmata.ctg9927~~Plantae.Rhodophyta-Palmaria_palmata.ctg9927.p1  ORF type:complete len:501 (-),score=42.54 Plantae.Rhodophyta-Palmaria_palmata.ctg9927:413-1915(-)